MNIVSPRVVVIPQLLSNVHIARCARICYGKGVYDDVLGYITKDEVTEAMKKVQELKPISCV